MKLLCRCGMAALFSPKELTSCVPIPAAGQPCAGGSIGIYIDGQSGPTAVQTEILCTDSDSGALCYALPDSATVAATARSAGYLSMDVDGDGSVEIPVQQPFPGYDDSSSEQVLLRLLLVALRQTSGENDLLQRPLFFQGSQLQNGLDGLLFGGLDKSASVYDCNGGRRALPADEAHHLHEQQRRGSAPFWSASPPVCTFRFTGAAVRSCWKKAPARHRPPPSSAAPATPSSAPMSTPFSTT